MIRPVKIDDFDAIKKLMQSEPGFWKYEGRADALPVALTGVGSLAFAWDEGGELLGFICAHDLGFRAYLSELIVHHSVRKRGIGRQLLVQAQDELRKRNCPVLLADAWRDAEQFYIKQGWSAPDVSLLRIKL